MPSTITEFNSPITFSTVWIFVKATSNLDGLDNNEVPRALSTRQSVKGSWGLYVNGVEQQKNQASEIFEIVGGGNYTVGDRIDSRTYRKTTDNFVTANETIIGTITAGSTGTGIIEGTPNLEETAWLVKFPIGADPISKILWQGSTIFEGDLQQHNRNTTGIDQPFGQNFYPLPEDLTIDKYTRGEFQYQNGEGWQVHKIAKKEPDQVVTETTNVPIFQDTFYEFYDVIWTTESEVSNFSASAALILPVHLLQRTLSQRSSDRKINGLDLKESFIRVAPDMSSAGVQVQDLYNNYGIEAYAIPITLNIGGNAVSLAINQIVDIDINNQQNNDVLKYVASGQKWQNTQLSTVALSGSYYDLVDEPPVPSITSLSDTTITNDGTSANTLADGHILRWNDSLSVWVNEPETAEVNDLTTGVTFVNIPDSHITESSVVQHQSALSIIQSQITDLEHYTNAEVDTHLNQSSATGGQVLTWNGSDYSWANTFDGTYASLTATPTTLAGYGITDAFDGTYASLTGKPTTLAGYGITDAATAAELTALAAKVTALETFQTTHAPNDETHP